MMLSESVGSRKQYGATLLLVARSHFLVRFLPFASLYALGALCVVDGSLIPIGALSPIGSLLAIGAVAYFDSLLPYWRGRVF